MAEEITYPKISAESAFREDSCARAMGLETLIYSSLGSPVRAGRIPANRHRHNDRFISAAAMRVPDRDLPAPTMANWR